MKSLMQVMFATIRGKFIRIYTKLRMLLNPAYFKARVSGKFRIFFSKLFSIRPRDKHDYYILGKWMLGKKLAFALIVIAGMLSMWFISGMLPTRTKTAGAIPQGTVSHKYSSLALKNYTGQASVIARKGYVAYVGQLLDGQAQGEGILYNKSGKVVYAGAFLANRYNGQGKLYYANADLRYEGAFSANLFNGKGKLYAEGGKLAYEGEFESGTKNGMGDLYDIVGEKIFSGRFYRGQILFTDFLEKSVASLGTAFTGAAISYRTSVRSCSAYPQLKVVFELQNSGNSLEEDATVKRLFLYEQPVTFDEKTPGTGSQLEEALGKPFYEGYSGVTFPEIAVISQLRTNTPDAFPDVTIPSFEKPFDEVNVLQEYFPTEELYIRSFQKDALIYTFYFPSKSEAYGFYAIETNAAPPALTDSVA